MVHLVTETGSNYVLDLRHKRWERTFSTPNSGGLRTHSGKYHNCTYALGQPLAMTCPAFLPGGPTRLIVTSPITAVEEKQDGTT